MNKLRYFPLFAIETFSKTSIRSEGKLSIFLFLFSVFFFLPSLYVSLSIIKDLFIALEYIYNINITRWIGTYFY